MDHKVVVNSYQNLVVWKASVEPAVSCYKSTVDFPSSERFGLTSQLRRASASVPANMPVGYGRDNTGSFVQLLRIAQGSLKELETHLIVAQRVRLLSDQTGNSLFAQCEEIGKMLRSLIRRLQGATSQ